MKTAEREVMETRSSAAVTRDWVRALEVTRRLREAPDAALASVVHDAAKTHGSAPALIGTDGHLTYAELSAKANRYARWALARELAAGDVVGLLMPNQADYVAIWLGLTQVGCVVALLNTNIAGDALAHCIRSAAARHVVVAGSLTGLAENAMARLPATICWWGHGEGVTGLPRIDAEVAHLRGEPLDGRERRPPSARDRALLIYTSGTTGLPKAANVTHARIMEWSGWFAGMMEAQKDDRLYNCLPMYHSVGGVVAIGSMLVAGGSVVIRERYSTSRFWDDVVDTDCTIVQYIGELCRYLLQSVPHERETGHRIRLFCGNGLRGDVWRDFQHRFHVPRILEFYAATEGNVSLTNCEARPGAIGRVPKFLTHRFPVALIRCDPETGEPLRDAAGRCIRCAEDEAGEAIGRIGGDDGGPARTFDGYTDEAASARKILHDVFASGDRWFRTGDLMRKDADGYFYFVDRLGDTFRWKGENVSSTEVAAVILKCPGVIDAVVYGVAIPGTEGKAGMAALVVNAGFSLSGLRDHMEANLPSYARPLFVRLCREIETTGTFKLKKTELCREGYADAAPDPVWFDERTGRTFIPCDMALSRRLRTGTMRL